MADTPVGLKRMRVAGSKRRDEWNRPNDKAKARLEARIAEYDKSNDKSPHGHLQHRPGSMKIR